MHNAYSIDKRAKKDHKMDHIQIEKVEHTSLHLWAASILSLILLAFLLPFFGTIYEHLVISMSLNRFHLTSTLVLKCKI